MFLLIVERKPYRLTCDNRSYECCLAGIHIFLWRMLIAEILFKVVGNSGETEHWEIDIFQCGDFGSC